jgi:tetratricopeptide (TPR) repeat protein
MRQSPLIYALYALIAGMGFQTMEGEVPDSGKAAREFFQAGRIIELSELASPGLRSRILAQPMEAYFAGEALLACNRSADALALAAEIEAALPRGMVGPFLRFREAEQAGRTGAAREIATERINRPDVTGYWWGRSALDWALLGKLKQAAGADAKVVLETCFERALRDDPNCEEACVFAVELALSCGDAELASTRVKDGLKRFPKNTALMALWGKALQWSSPKEAAEKWLKALESNPNQLLARASLAEAAFIMEDAAALQEHLSLLPASDCEAGALQLARSYTGSTHQTPGQEQKSHGQNSWALHRAGVLLSARYRFSGGAGLQEKALSLDPGLLPAKRALAEDLLRLGRSAEAWPMLEEVHRRDGYDITAFNLLELRDRVAGFTRVESEHFEVWMAPSEAAVYGDRVTNLLERAYGKLAAKYRFKPAIRTTVEIFPEQKDFAVRTFGVPGGDGYLGVCFGPVITAPSPASPRAAGHSWEATLWHEFTHTLTLTLTRNRMPRWLSEGISVHEEQQANPAWGQRFRPRHAGRLLKGQFTPVDRMSEAFRTGDGGELDFAYFQAGLIVDWMVRKSGVDKLRGLLEELGKGAEINAAISKIYGPMEQVNADFSKYAAAWVQEMAGTLAWKVSTKTADEKAGDKPAGAEQGGAGNAARKTYEDLMREGQRAFASKDLETARERFEAVLKGAPRMHDSEGALFWLVKIYRALGLDEREIETLQSALRCSADFGGAHERLIELYARKEDWPRLAETAASCLGVSPMSVRVLEGLGRAHEQMGNQSAAVDAFERALKLDPERAPRWHSKIGTLLQVTDPAVARGHLLDALEVNPRDRSALEALARIASKAAKGALRNSGSTTPVDQKQDSAAPTVPTAKGGEGK